MQMELVRKFEIKQINFKKLKIAFKTIITNIIIKKIQVKNTIITF